MDEVPRKGGIDREVLEALHLKGMSHREMAADLDVSLSTLRRWLRKHGFPPGRADLKEIRQARDDGEKHMTRVCRRHGETSFVLEGRGFYRCRKCRSAAVSRRRRLVKEILVRESGGACVICGYSRSAAALQFHHRDPLEKRFSLSQMGVSRSIANARAEAKKCILLCANCHAEVEYGVTSLPVKLRPAAVPG